MDDIIIRQATPEDIPFLAKTIVEAEKSGTEHAIMAKYFGISNEELLKYMTRALEEDADGCEFSVSSYIVADYKGRPVSTQAGWMEGYPDGTPSEVIKSNLLMYVMPREVILGTKERAEIARTLHVERDMGTYQLEFSYTEPEFRGKHLVHRVLMEHCRRAKYQYHAHYIRGHQMQMNENSVKSKEKFGFHLLKNVASDDPRILEIYPDKVLRVIELDLDNFEIKENDYPHVAQRFLL